MNLRFPVWMTLILLACMAILLGINLLPFLGNSNTQKYINYDDVRGMAVEHKGKLYTLNFEQQNEIIKLLNLAIPVDNVKIPNDPPKFDFEHIIIYRFGEKEIVITPKDYIEDNLIFSTPEWNHDGLLKDMSHGALKTFLPHTYDDS